MEKKAPKTKLNLIFLLLNISVMVFLFPISTFCQKTSISEKIFNSQTLKRNYFINYRTDYSNDSTQWTNYSGKITSVDQQDGLNITMNCFHKKYVTENDTLSLAVHHNYKLALKNKSIDEYPEISVDLRGSDVIYYQKKQAVLGKVFTVIGGIMLGHALIAAPWAAADLPDGPFDNKEYLYVAGTSAFVGLTFVLAGSKMNKDLPFNLNEY